MWGGGSGLMLTFFVAMSNFVHKEINHSIHTFSQGNHHVRLQQDPTIYPIINLSLRCIDNK